MKSRSPVQYQNISPKIYISSAGQVPGNNVQMWTVIRTQVCVPVIELFPDLFGNILLSNIVSPVTYFGSNLIF